MEYDGHFTSSVVVIIQNRNLQAIGRYVTAQNYGTKNQIVHKVDLNLRSLKNTIVDIPIYNPRYFLVPTNSENIWL